ncbi:aminopeptidase [Peribacillus saganii]|nr:aminopeptidase [Peribacillus saganii]
MNIEVFRYAAVPVQMNVKKGETVVILTDDKVNYEIQEALVAAVYYEGATPILVRIPPADSFGNEPHKVAAAALLEADLILSACSTAMTHTDAIREALKSGARYLAMGGITIESLTNGAATANYEEVTETSLQIAEILDACKRIRVTSSIGTDLTFSLEGRPSFPLTGVISGQRKIAAFPDGEVATAPVEGTANGTIVIDGVIHHIGKVSSPIELTIKDGFVTRIEGNEDAQKLERFLNERGDANSFNLGEFAIGTNKKARLADNAQESKKMLGTIHFALGDNRTLAGHTYSKTHIDCLILKPNVWIDEKQFIAEGIILKEAIVKL